MISQEKRVKEIDSSALILEIKFFCSSKHKQYPQDIPIFSLFLFDSETIVVAVVGFRLRIKGFMDLTYFCLFRLITDVVVEIWKSWANKNIFLGIIIVANLLMATILLSKRTCKIR